MFKKYMRYKIVKLAWPVVLEMSWIMVVNILITAMVGKLGPVALAAVGLGLMVQFSTAMIFAAAGTGTSVIVAREAGAENWLEVRRVSGQGILLSIILGLLLGVIGCLLAPWLFSITGAEEQVAALSIDLLQITFLFTPFYLLMVTGNAIFRGLGQTKKSFYISSLSNGTSLTINYMLINGYILPKLGAYGTAWGSGIAQLVGSCLVLYALFTATQTRLSLKDIFIVKPLIIKRILRISIPAGLEQLALQGGRIAYTFMLASVGTMQFAAHQIAMQVESLSFMPGFAFSVAATTLVGQHLGRRLHHRAAQYARLTNKIAIISMSLMGLVFFVFSKQLTGLFVYETEVVYWGALCVMIAALEQPTLAITYVLAGSLRGAGDTKWPMYITTTGVWLVRIPLIYLFIVVLKYNITAAWFITASDFLVRSCILWWRFSSNRWMGRPKTI